MYSQFIFGIQNELLSWVEFDAGGVKLGIERVDSNSSIEDKALIGRFLGVSLQVKDVESSYKHLMKEGVEFIAPPEKQGWGGTLAHLKDTSGNIITLVSEKA